MKPEKQKCLLRLLHALRSNKYDNFTSPYMKHRDGKANPLGVACEVYMKYTGKGMWESNNYNHPYDALLFTTDTDYAKNSSLPSSVAYYFGLSSDPSVKFSYLSPGHQATFKWKREGGKWVKVSVLANGGVSHKEIAHYLEATYM